MAKEPEPEVDYIHTTEFKDDLKEHWIGLIKPVYNFWNE